MISLHRDFSTDGAAIAVVRRASRPEVLIIEKQRRMQLRLAAIALRALDCAVFCEKSVDDAKKRAARLDAMRLVLIDVRLSWDEGMAALNYFRDNFPNARAIVISANSDRQTVAAALKAGAAAYVLRNYSSRIMVAIVRLVLAKGIYVPADVLAWASDHVASETHHQAAEQLTERQRQVLRLALRPLTHDDIAAELQISGGTLKQHLNAIFRALRVGTLRSRPARAVEILFLLGNRGTDTYSQLRTEASFLTHPNCTSERASSTLRAKGSPSPLL